MKRVFNLDVLQPILLGAIDNRQRSFYSIILYILALR